MGTRIHPQIPEPTPHFIMIKELFRTASIWVIVLPLVAGFINFKGLNKDSRWIFLLVIAALVPQLLTAFLLKSSPLLNITYNTYTLLEFGGLYILFSHKYQQTTHLHILRITGIAYALYAAYTLLQNGWQNTFLNNLVCANNIIYIAWILFLLKEQYSLPNTTIRPQNPFAWYLLALLVYAPGSVIEFALYHYIREPANQELLNLWIIQSICNILLYVLFSIGLFIPRQKANF